MQLTCLSGTGNAPVKKISGRQLPSVEAGLCFRFPCSDPDGNFS